MKDISIKNVEKYELKIGETVHNLTGDECKTVRDMLNEKFPVEQINTGGSFIIKEYGHAPYSNKLKSDFPKPMKFWCGTSDGRDGTCIGCSCK